MRPQYHNLQALRGVACVMAIGFHLWDREVAFGIESPVFREIRWFGFAGVDLFFVLSGFLITAANRHHQGRTAAVPGYLFRRFWRLYPTYWVAMAVTAVVGWAALGWPVLDAGWPADWPSWLSLAPSPASNLVLPQAWTLTFEVAFYLAVGIAIPLPSRWAAAAFWGWAAAVGVAAAWPEPQATASKLLLSPFVLEFLGGCAVARLAARGVRRGGRTALVLGIGYAAAAAVVADAVSAKPFLHQMASSRVRVLVFGPPAVLLLYGLVAAEGRWPRRVPGWLLKVGDASYSLYLSHSVVIGAAMVAGMWFPHSRLNHTGWVVGTFAAILAVGLLFHAGVERPLLNLARRRPIAPPPASRPGATPRLRAA